VERIGQVGRLGIRAPEVPIEDFGDRGTLLAAVRRLGLPPVVPGGVRPGLAAVRQGSVRALLVQPEGMLEQAHRTVPGSILSIMPTRPAKPQLNAYRVANSAMRPRMPLRKRGLSSVDICFASSTASVIATGSSISGT